MKGRGAASILPDQAGGRRGRTRPGRGLLRRGIPGQGFRQLQQELGDQRFLGGPTSLHLQESGVLVKSC